MDVPRGGLTATRARASAPTLAPAPRASASGAAGGHDPQRLLLFPWSVADGARNMALDEAMMELARSGRAALRFYGWSPPCLSLGRNQRAGRPGVGGRRPAPSPGVEVVRRPTGGRSVFHGPEITYAIALPERALGGPRSAYARINAALAGGLEELGVAVDPRSGSDPGSQRRRGGSRSTASGPGADGQSHADPLGGGACFADPAPGELTVGGRKLVGSAQWRHRGAILQHGSILIEDLQSRAALDARRERTGGVGLVELLGRRPDASLLIPALASSFASGLQWEGTPAEPTRGLLATADRLEARYRSAEWTWRR